MTAVNIRIVFKPAKWPENLKNSRAGKLMMWRVGWVAAQPDGDTFLALGYGAEHRDKRITRASIFRPSTSFMRSRRSCPTGPSARRCSSKRRSCSLPTCRTSSSATASKPPCFIRGSIGYRRHSFMRAMWKYVDIDQRRQRRARRMTSDQPAIRTQSARCHFRLRRSAAAQTSAPNGKKVLRYAFEVAETGFDPVSLSDLVFAHRHGAHLRRTLSLRLPGAAFQDQALHGRGNAGGLGGLPRLDSSAEARNLFSGRCRV